MTGSIPLAIGLVVIASMCFATGAVGQFAAVARAKGGGAGAPDERNTSEMTPRQFLSLLANPRWLGSTALIGLGAGLHLVALTMAPVTVIQPVGILAVAWSVILSSRIQGYRTNSGVWTGVAMTIVGIVGFTLLAARYASDQAYLHPPLIIGAAIGVAIAGVLLALVSGRAGEAFRCLGLASAGAILYGLASALMKTMFLFHSEGHPILSPGVLLPVVGIVLTYAVGGWVIQQAHAVGHAEIVVASLTTVDPVVAVLFGILVLGEGAHITPLAYAGMIVTAAIAIAGAVVLSKYHPEVRQRQEAERAKAGARA